MSQFSKMKHSRDQWKHKAKQRGDRERYQRKQLARISAERDRVTKALKEAQERLRQLEASPWISDVQPISAQTVVQDNRPVTAFSIRAAFRRADSAYIRTVPLSQSVR